MKYIKAFEIKLDKIKTKYLSQFGNNISEIIRNSWLMDIDPYSIVKDKIEDEIKKYGNAKRIIEFKDKEGGTPIFTASHKRRCDLIKLLVENGANINHINKQKNTTLSIAIDLRESINLISCLIDCGADLNYYYEDKNRNIISIYNKIKQYEKQYPDYFNKLLTIDSIDMLMNSKKYNL